ncbi:hypothetical protein [Mucilaginibacter sp. SMC90]|uniref:hypothetical protein n=1 Tax=Mucilaginibacter sp. SMC90 TaxID=2929803 RepID=UPI0035301733
MNNKTIVLQALLIVLVIIAIVWEVTRYITEHRFAEMPKQLMGAVFLCWLVYILSRTPQDDDDWAGQYQKKAANNGCFFLIIFQTTAGFVLQFLYTFGGFSLGQVLIERFTGFSA